MPRVKRLLAVVTALVAACSVGDGEGEVRGRLMVPACNLAVPRYSMQPDFFGGDWHEGSFTIHIARGGSTDEVKDELVLLIDDTGYVAEHLNERLAVGAPGVTPVHAILRLTKSCGAEALVTRTPDVAMPATRGYVVFEAIYRGAPSTDAAARRTTVSAFSMAFDDPRVVRDTTYAVSEPVVGEGREPAVVGQSRAELEGRFDFYFTRGRPAQHFP